MCENGPDQNHEREAGEDKAREERNVCWFMSYLGADVFKHVADADPEVFFSLL